MRKHLAVLAFIGVLTLPLTLQATPISGQFSITGSSVNDNGSTLTFIPNTIAVGAANTLTESFLTLLTPGEAGTISSTIQYSPFTPGSASFTLGTAPGTTVTFLIESLTETVVGPITGFTGTGLISTNAAGFDTSHADLYFSTQASGNVTFSATAIAPAPEPSAFLLLGTGTLGICGVAKRRWFPA